MLLPFLPSSRDKAGLLDKICSARDSVIPKRKWTWAQCDSRSLSIQGGPFFLKPTHSTSSCLLVWIPMGGGHCLSTCQKEYVTSCLDSSSLYLNSWSKVPFHLHALFLLLVRTPVSPSNNWHWKWPRPSEEAMFTPGPWSYKLQHYNQTKMWCSHPDFHNDVPHPSDQPHCRCLSSGPHQLILHVADGSRSIFDHSLSHCGPQS